MIFLRKRHGSSWLSAISGIVLGGSKDYKVGMKRDLKALTGRKFDVVVAGCGVYGAFIAREAAIRGLSVAIIDAGDFCCATSANSLKTIHGGLRYLQQLDIDRVRRSACERRNLMYIAPHLIHPLPCLMPTTGLAMRSKPVMRMGLLVNDILSFDRNTTGDPEKTIPAGIVVSRDECLRLIPGLTDPRITGAAMWTDASTYNSERLVLDAVLSACDSGAVAANYVRLAGFIRNNGSITGIIAEDSLTGARFEVQSSLVINSAGPWIPEILSMLDTKMQSPIRRLALAMNFVLTRQLFPTYAAGLTSPEEANRKKRLLFFVPWRGRTIAGTYYREHQGKAGDMKVTENDISLFLGDINRAYPPAHAVRADIALIHAGLLPADPVDAPNSEPEITRHYSIIDHRASDGIDGLLTVVGVKYTTARDVAASTIDIAFRKLGRNGGRKSFSIEKRLHSGDIPDFNRFLREATQSTGTKIRERDIVRLVRSYGSDYRTVLDLCSEDDSLGRPVGDSPDLIGAEVVHAVRSEMAQTLADIVLRRTDLGSAGRPDTKVLWLCAELMAREAGWDSRRTSSEIDRTLGAAVR